MIETITTININIKVIALRFTALKNEMKLSITVDLMFTIVKVSLFSPHIFTNQVWYRFSSIGFFIYSNTVKWWKQMNLEALEVLVVVTELPNVE